MSKMKHIVYYLISNPVIFAPQNDIEYFQSKRYLRPHNHTDGPNRRITFTILNLTKNIKLPRTPPSEF